MKGRKKGCKSESGKKTYKSISSQYIISDQFPNYIHPPQTISLVCSYPEKTMSIDNQALTALKNSGQEVKNNTNQTSELSKEEKLRKRREQLELWRQKKQQQQQEQEEVQNKAKKTEDSTNNTSTEEVKKSRQQRIEEWKRARLQKQQATKEKTTTITIKKKVHLQTTRPTLKRNLDFGDDEDDMKNSHRPVFKKPSLEYDEILEHQNDKESEDELDVFLASIRESELKSDNTKAEKAIESIPEGDVENEKENDDYGGDGDEEDELDEESRLQDLISTKLTKLQNKGKELQSIDHSQENYQEFRKVFYREAYELLALLDEQVELIRQDLDNIKVKGTDVPRPILKWSHLALPTNLSSVIHDKLKFEKPSAIQSQALPTILSGRDVIGIAKTGSGKTLSYVLPMLRHIQDQQFLKDNQGPIGLILSPTRELALQIEKEILNFTKRNNSLRVCCCYGGSSIENQINELKKGVEIIVGTPGRVIDLLAANSGRVLNLKRCTFVVLDEADRMFDLGFEPQVNKILTQIRPDRQTVLFSATFPRKMETLAKQILTDPVVIIVGGISVVAPEIKQEVVLFETSAEEQDKYKQQRVEKLHDILTNYQIEHPDSKILVFTEKQNDADELVANLLSNKYPAIAIHGGKDQMDRKYAIKEFASMDSGINILIATSIAARGLDVRNLGLVINFDPPNHMEDYVHRVGRTGRAGAKGNAITFVSSSQPKEVFNLVKALKLSHSDIDPKLEEIANKFVTKVKAGKEKISSGFGGKGLDNLQEVRDNKLKLEKQRFGDQQPQRQQEETETKKLNDEPVPDIALPEFNIIEGNTPETSGPDKCKFYCRIVINDLPQKVRWNIVQRESLSKIIDESRTSITTRGQYYPPGSKPLSNDQERNGSLAKLYLLVEGLTLQSVTEAITLIKKKMLESLDILNQRENLQPTGRYVV